MKLFYYKKDQGNFGDDLNSWLWEKVIKTDFDENDKSVFFGIGTIINDRIYDRAPNAQKIIVFSSGVGYGKTPLENLPTIDERWKIYCVRGPLSAKALGLSSDFAVTDGAALIRRFYVTDSKKKIEISYMPHVDQAVKHGSKWKSICEELGYGYIDPRWEREDVLNSLGKTEILVTEAMHGAIVADSLRVPWIPVVTNEKVFRFKWEDWCKSIGLLYEPVDIEGFFQKQGFLHRIKDRLATKNILSSMKNIKDIRSPILSKDSTIEQLTIRLEEKVEEFNRDISSGLFSNI